MIPTWLRSNPPCVIRYSISSFSTAAVTVSSKGGIGPTLSSLREPTPLRLSSPSLIRLIFAPNRGPRFSCSERYP